MEIEHYLKMFLLNLQKVTVMELLVPMVLVNLHFLKILAGEIEPNKGEVIIEPHKRLSVLKQDHFAYDENKSC